MSEQPHSPPPPNSLSPGLHSSARPPQGPPPHGPPQHGASAQGPVSGGPYPPGFGAPSCPDGPRMPVQLRIQRVMLFLMPAWTVLMLPNLINWENVHLFGAWDALLALWLMVPGAAALTCGLLLRRGGWAVLYAIAGLCAAIVALNFWFFEFGGPPVLQAIPYTVLTAVPLFFPSSWRYGREFKLWRSEQAAV